MEKLELGSVEIHSKEEAEELMVIFNETIGDNDIMSIIEEHTDNFKNGVRVYLEATENNIDLAFEKINKISLGGGLTATVTEA